MNKIKLMLASLLLAGCNTGPEVIPDNTTDSVIMMKLKHEILNGDQISQNWGWILWYLPVLFLVVAWAWKEFINKPIHLDDKEDAEADKPQGTDSNQQPPAAP
jgi:hypothetical protein